MSLSIEGALRNKSFDGFTDENDRPVPREKVKAELEQRKALGHRLFPMCDCPGFDPQTGCPGPAPSDTKGGEA